MLFHSVFQSQVVPERALQIVSFLPIALFAENLRAQNSLLSCVCSSSSLATPLTGCIKDLNRLWFPNFRELFDGFEPARGRMVVSIRNGNSFSLVNGGFLQLAKLLEEPGEDSFNLQHPRPVTVRVTFVLPLRPFSTVTSSIAFWIRHGINAFHTVGHLVLALVLGSSGFYIGSLLMGCLALLDILQAILRHATSVKFSQPQSAGGKPIPISRDDAIDTHIIVKSENDPHMNVLVGYSVQLHAMTNIPMRPTNPRLLLWVLRAIDITLVTQATALACLTSGNLPLEQNLGSVIWLICYLLMLFAAGMLKSSSRDLFLECQPGTSITAPIVSFSSRSAALIFISQLPVEQREQVGFSWMDKFIPNNKRRNDWLNKVFMTHLFSTESSQDCDDERVLRMALEVQKGLQTSSFRSTLNKFWSHIQNISDEQSVAA